MLSISQASGMTIIPVYTSDSESGR
ncbi:hypothetical protein JMJ77_0010251 [Colletotrichum scovillei]|uniref:Uncharacterized protein n=1 Tax=Colletotrichum scovillei TaxID=1209932 RepID=A0A9P7U750_9PEZI|nr:hypothetical protein JMJ78_0011592 [Colletotrichum scovillei]KAG7042148.1 hypothetical protein JMJ77_0010251 [Colletotrichum scovillei]KAG7062142.1 hypothetical protein JMJ76_0006420 [Colletotrichum scovillei]